MKILIFGLPGSGKSTLAKPFADLICGVHLNADTVRKEYNDWDFTPEGRNRQASRMKYLADGVVKAGKIAVADFVCPTPLTRLEFDPDYTPNSLCLEALYRRPETLFCRSPLYRGR